jgi:hypothetical protein
MAKDEGKKKANFHASAFSQLDGFAVPALVVKLVVEPVETLSRHSAVLRDPLRGRSSTRTLAQHPFGAQARSAEMME